jgi:hypothetical protein
VVDDAPEVRRAWRGGLGRSEAARVGGRPWRGLCYTDLAGAVGQLTVGNISPQITI